MATVVSFGFIHSTMNTELLPSLLGEEALEVGLNR